MVAFVLVHSPLVGPLTWSLVVEEMQRRGITAIAPELPDARDVRPPYWKAHVEAVALSMNSLPGDEQVVLIGHSGGGMLLPAIRQASSRSVSKYLFVDAGIPQDGKSRLDFFGKDEAEQFRAAAERGMLPGWTEDDLTSALPDTAIRRKFVQELRPLPHAVYEEPIPVFEGWPDAPCGYLQFTPTYQHQAEHAQREGWRFRMIEGGHFLMLIDPLLVTEALLELA